MQINNITTDVNEPKYTFETIENERPYIDEIIKAA